MPIEILEDRIAPASVLVVSLADSGPGTLRNAIVTTNASSDSTNDIIFANGLHGTILLKSPLPAITNAVTIGGTTNAKVAIDGANDFQIFNVNGSSMDVNFTNLTLEFGNSVNIGGAKVRGGGAIYISDYSGTVKISNCIITHNRALGLSGATESSGIGGGVFLSAGTLDITNSKITGNLAEGGHGSAASSSGRTGEGGGIYASSSGTLVVTSSTITGNIAEGGIGTPGARGANGAPMTAGTAGGRGGQGGSGQGGGLWNYGTATVSKSTISGNVAIGGRGANGAAGGNGGFGASGGSGGEGGYGGFGQGGGVYSEDGTLTLNSSTLSGNIADGNLSGLGGPGGVAGRGGRPGSHGYGPVHALGEGGGVHSAYGTLDTVDVTVARNLADQGGGIFLYENTATQLDNSTIAFNKARQAREGGGLWAYIETSGPVIVISTVIGQNVTGAGGAGQDLLVNTGQAIAAYSSLIESFSAASITAPSSIMFPVLENVNPLLLPLHNNGGPTWTCIPSSVKSPLIGAGTLPVDTGLPNMPTVSDDQRGHGRTVAGTVDIGAVEVA
jgi:hypothetical protein